MDSPHERLLLRYIEAAKSIADSETTEHDNLDGVSRLAEPTPPAFEATHELLQRQARLLVTAHNSIENGNTDSDTAASELIQRRLDDVASITMSKLYAYRYDSVPVCWRELYTETLVLLSYISLLQTMAVDADEDSALGQIVQNLDRALITTGGISKTLSPRWIDDTMELLGEWCSSGLTEVRQSKRQKTAETPPPVSFEDREPYGRPKLTQERECERLNGWTLEWFEDYMNGGVDPVPVVFSDLITDWPALTDSPWKSISHLMSHTVDGRRLVPVEIGRSYVDEGWGQELIPFKDFLDRYVIPSEAKQTGYLAQHNLFRQIPSLRNDITIPDFCWAQVPLHPLGPRGDHPTLDVPQLNAWFGPAKTITPLHTDGYHNLLCQVVGTKYVRLYPPREGQKYLRPRPTERGIDMSNTSAVDLGVVEGWDELPDGDDEIALEELRRELEGVPYKECILGPGDTLLIPIGWWHYVRSLSVSFSVSFWWN